VPREGTTIFNSENCAYNGHCRSSKNCYLCSLVSKAEDVYYSYWVSVGRKVFDSSMVNFCENIYNCLDVTHCNFCFSCQECRDSQECYFSYQLKNCQNCIACSNLVGKQYYVYNISVTKEGYEKTLKVIQSDKNLWDRAQTVFEKIRSNSLRPGSQFITVENSTGDHLQNCRDCIDCFDGLNGENLRHVWSFMDSKDSTWIYSSGWPYCDMSSHVCVIRDSNHVHYSFYLYSCKNSWYCDSCRNSSDLFGCIGINHGQYILLNKAYSQNEYETLMARVIDHMRSTGEW
jgi:hypothetical protein